MKRKILGLSLILCLALVLCFTSVFATRGAANAENVDVLVYLTNDSLLTSYGDCFAYTNGKSIYLVKNNTSFECKATSEFDGFVDIAMNSKYVLALVKNGDEKYLWAYEYNTLRIAKINYTSNGIFENYIVGIYADDQGNFFEMETNKVNSISLSTDKDTGITTLTVNSGLFNSNTNLEEGTYKDVEDFSISDDIDKLYCISQGNLYVVDEPSFNHDLSYYHKEINGYAFKGITSTNGKILLLDSKGIYQYNDANSSILALTTDGLNADSRICSAYDSVNKIYYVYTKSNINAVNMYVYTQSNLDYYGCFDSTKYVNPKEYDIVKLYKSDADVTLYSSPRHLQRMGTIPTGSYFIALSERDEYVYVYYKNPSEDKPQLGYIKKSAGVTLCPANREGEFGAFVQPLHEDTPIYKYPFEGSGSEKILDASRYMQLTFIDNVGQDENFSWGWYKVGFVDGNGNTQYGYVKSNNLSPYTQLTAPSLSKAVKLTSKKLGQYITLYALPFENEEDAIEVTQLPEGTVVYLREKYNKKSQWTAVYYEGKTAYVRTANVKASGLTSWQLALAITIPCVVVAIAIATTLIILAKKKKRVYNFY